MDLRRTRIMLAWLHLAFNVDVAVSKYMGENRRAAESG